MNMTEGRFHLSWNAYQNNICQGISSLQQNGEFVDMTLAADGHYVKVHQMVMSLVSPYIKDLISSAQCPHPVIFLNQISYKTLCSILEYIYTGEAYVNRENLKEFVEAGRALHINGLKDIVQKDNPDQSTQASSPTEEIFRQVDQRMKMSSSNDNNVQESYVENSEVITDDHDYDEVIMNESNDKTQEDTTKTDTKIILDSGTSNKNIKNQIKYTMSNQGCLQVVLNRYIYNSRYTFKNGNYRWQCIDYPKANRCPAFVVTRDDIVIQRKGTHNHPYHDMKILKKVRNGSIFSAIHQAKELSNKIKKDKAASATNDEESDVK